MPDCSQSLVKLYIPRADGFFAVMPRKHPDADTYGQLHLETRDTQCWGLK